MPRWMPSLCLLLVLVAVGGAAAERTHVIVPEDYFSLQYAGNPVLTPDGSLAAWVQSGWEGPGGGRATDLWAADRRTPAPLRLTFEHEGVHGAAWGPDGWLYFGGRLDREAEEPPYDGSHQVWRIRADGTDLQPVSRVDDGVGLFQLDAPGAALYYTVGEDDHEDEWRDLKQKWKDLEYGHGTIEYSAVRRLDLRSWRDEEILPATRVINAMVLSPDGRRLALQTTPDEEIIFNEGWSRIDVVDLASREVTQVTGPAWRTDHPSPYGWLTEMAWCRDGSALAFGISYDGYASQIWVAELGGAAPELFRVTRPGLVTYGGGLAWRGDGRSLLYIGDERGRARIYQTDDVRGGRQGATSTLTPGDVVVGSFACDERGRTLVLAADLTDRTGDLYNLEKGTLRPLTDANPQMATWILPQILDYTWTGADGDEVHGILELPAGHDPQRDGPLPTIVELHGGPTSCTQFRFRLWIYGRALMAANGYALLSPNYHGSTGYGDEFLGKLIGRENEIEVTDIAAGTEALINAGIADPGRIGVMGWSNGGYLTNCMITQRPDLYRAASSGAGVLDMVIQWGIEDTPGHVINFMEGLPWEKAEHYRRASPLYALDKVQTPTLIHVGGDDPRVPAAHSKALYRALHHYLNVPVELVVYPGEGHGLSTYENRLAKMEWDLAWFATHLLGEANGDGR